MYLFIRIAPCRLLMSEIKATRILDVLYEVKGFTVRGERVRPFENLSVTKA